MITQKDVVMFGGGGGKSVSLFYLFYFVTICLSLNNKYNKIIK